MTERKLERVKQIADAVLYEGHLLYPYRPSALKNRQRWLFGRVYPRAYSEARHGGDPWYQQTECLVLGRAVTRLDVQVRFLQITGETAPGGKPSDRDEDAAPVREEHSASCRDPMEREVVIADEALADLLSGPRCVRFAFPAPEATEVSPTLTGPEGVAAHRRWSIEGSLELSVERADYGCYKLSVRVRNDTPLERPDPADEDAVLQHTLLSAHTILEVREGRFVSLIDPPDPLGPSAAACRNVGTWPVLVGDEGDLDMMLSAPLILYDYPRVAPESPGDYFDGTEVDELLTLRVLTLTEQEKREVRSLGGHAKALLERTEGLTPEQILRLHGAVRCGACSSLRVGARVRLRPRGRSDAMDLILEGKMATVVSLEEDYEGRTYLAVTVDEDPGQDLGRHGRPGHRFFFRPEEVEPLAIDGKGTP